MPVLHSTPFLTVHFDPSTATLETEWLDFVNSDDLRAALDEALRLGRLYGVRGWIGNNKRMRTIRPADQDWMNQVWFPEFAKLGVRRLAVVVSDDALNRMGIDNILQRASDLVPFDTQYFADAAEARRWVGEKEELRVKS